MFVVKILLPFLKQNLRLLRQNTVATVLLWMGGAGFVFSQDAGPQVAESPAGMYITEYRILGAKRLDKRSVEKAVYPFLGPERQPEDVDAAREALEKAYRDAGYSTVSVTIPSNGCARGWCFFR